MNLRKIAQGIRKISAEKFVLFFEDNYGKRRKIKTFFGDIYKIKKDVETIAKKLEEEYHQWEINGGRFRSKILPQVTPKMIEDGEIILKVEGDNSKEHVYDYLDNKWNTK